MAAVPVPRPLELADAAKATLLIFSVVPGSPGGENLII